MEEVRNELENWLNEKGVKIDIELKWDVVLNKKVLIPTIVIVPINEKQKWPVRRKK